MKKALLKDSFKEIKNTYKRFISILLMAFLGVGFFAGIKATSPDMVETINTFYKKQNVYDIQVISTLGLTKEDIQALEQIEGIEKIVGSYEMDGQLDVENKEVIVKTMTIEEINKPILIDGKFPEAKEECVVEEKFLENNQMKIGDTIELEIAKTTNKDGEEVDYLKQKQLKIVGTVQSPLYISGDRGTSTLGTGKVNYYMYISKENIQETETYTNIYVKVKEADKYTTSSKEYEEYIEQVKNKIEDIKEERQTARHQELVQTTTKKIEEAESTLNAEKQDAQKQIKEIEDEISKGKNEIQKAEEEINNNEKKANNEFIKADKKLKQAKEELEKQESIFEQKEQEINLQLSEAEKNKQELQNKLAQLEETLKTVDTNYQQIIEYLKNPNLSEEQKKELEKTKYTLEIQKQKLEESRQQLITGITQIETGIATAKQQIQSGKKELKQGKLEINKQEQKLKQTKSNTYEELKNAKEKINTSKQELAKGEEELNKSKQELEEKIKEAEEKIIDSKQKIAEIENPKWYILDRHGNVGYTGFIQDTESIAKIGAIFPIVFFIVASLISLTSMTRMVEEQRTQIGTLKALGYNKLQIASKYIIYASLATVIGSILGMSVGFNVIPRIAWKMYEAIYTMIPIEIDFNIKYGTLGLFFILVCIVGATIYATMKELISTPASLMRPKAPKIGKRVLLEKIPFIWKHLSFSRKVTLRNLFRYKKRFLMTVIGILGCTALILTGFGIKDSIATILPSQFGKIFTYDMQITLKNGLDEEQKENYKKELLEKEEIKEITGTYMMSGTVINKTKEEDVQIIIPEKENELENMITINDIKTKQKTHLKEGEICLTDKVAQLLGVKAGDIIILRDNDNTEKEVKISNIVENYIMHYIYMTKETYESLYEKKYETNVLLTKNIELNEEQEEKISTEIMNNKEVATINRTSITTKALDDTMKSMNYIVLILIVSAGLLAFVVLYNLANVNISEKIRELATIKVLGFYDKEVYDYVTRETILLTLIGVLLGLIGGYYLNYFIIGTCELNMFRFCKVIEPISYLYAVLITIGFTAIVNLMTYFALKKINMIESLKSVE